MDSLGLSKRIIVALRRGGVTDLDKLLAISRKDLSMIPGIGVGALKEIEARLVDSHDPVVAKVTAEIDRVRAGIEARTQRNKALERTLEHLEVKRRLRFGRPGRSRQREPNPE